MWEALKREVDDLSKIVERAINSKIETLPINTKQISSSQYRFRRCVGNLDALVRVTDYISRSLDQNDKCLLFYLNLTKAFDTVAHPTLLKEIPRLGIRGVAHNILKSYPDNRIQQVKFGNSLGKSFAVENGVPQGAVHGPQLFTMYINSLIQMVGSDHTVCYGEDIVLLLKGNSWDIVYRKAESVLRLVRTGKMPIL